MNDLISYIVSTVMVKAMLKTVKFDDETEFVEWYDTVSSEEKEKMFEKVFEEYKNDHSKQCEISIEEARNLCWILLEWYYRKAIALTKKEKKKLDKVYSKKITSIFLE